MNSIMKTIALALLCTVSLTASAQMKTRGITDARTKSSGIIKEKKNLEITTYNSDKFVVTVSPKGKAPRKVAPEDYGTKDVKLYEDFSKMTTGSEGNPDLTVDILLEEYDYPWWNTNPAYTNEPHWGSSNTYPAGGMVFMNAYYNDDYDCNAAHLNTPLVNVSDNDGIAWLQFDARCEKGKTCERLIVEAAETNNMGPSWNLMGDVLLPAVTDQWQTYTIYFYNGGPTSLFNIYDYYDNAVYIDNVTVSTVKQFIGVPVAQKHTNYKGTSFDLNWTAVEGADHYAVNVYRIDEVTGATEYIFQNKEVSTNTFTATGMTSGDTYYYNIYAIDENDRWSLPSKTAYVFDIETPVMNAVTDLDGLTYSASWNAVPTADRYNYFAYGVRTAEIDGEFIVTNEDFTGVADSDGNLTGWTVNDHSYQSYDTYYIPEMHQAGWKGTHYAPYTDYICLDGWHYAYGNGDAGLISPELDLSKDGGKFNVSVKLYGDHYYNWINDDEYTDEYTQCAVALFNYNEKIGDYEQSELIYATNKKIKNEWQKCDMTFTTGSVNSVLGLYAVWAPENLYIDDLRITQNYKKGESLNEPFLFSHWHQGESISVSIPATMDKGEISHKVSAFKTAYDYGEVESAYSQLQTVGTANGIAPVTMRKATVMFSADGLSIRNIGHENVSIYNTAGQLIYSNHSGAENINVSVPQHGNYIVMVGSNSIKIQF